MNDPQKPTGLFVLPGLPPLNTRLSVPRALALIFQRVDADDFRRSVCVTSFIRLSDHALYEYKLAQHEATAYRESRNGDSLSISAAMRAVAHLETSLTALHRAACFLMKLGTYPDVQQLTAGREIATGRTRVRLRDMRNAIQHLDGKLCDDEFPVDSPIMLIAQAGFLEVERHRIELDKFVQWLSETQAIAAALAKTASDAPADATPR
jgi:hypothetical protein